MSGHSISLYKRRRCEASGRNYTSYGLRHMPDENGKITCPACRKRVSLRQSSRTGKLTAIPNHYELVVG